MLSASASQPSLQIKSPSLLTPKQSLNRSAFSIPTDVLFSKANEFQDWGVLSFKVTDLPEKFPADIPEYDFFPKHVPLEDNYSHTEVWCDGCLHPTGDYVTPGKGVKKLLRAHLSQRLTKEIEAKI
jgi:hypothetical protein